jgi:hypothetical protein
MPLVWAASNASAISMARPSRTSVSTGFPVMRCIRVMPSRNSNDDKGVAIPLAYVMNGAEVGMIERGRGARFAAKAFQRLTVPGQVIRKKLEGDKAAEVRVLGFVDHAIPPPPNFSRMR